MRINGVEHTIAPKADLREADLRAANLGGADLRGANLGGADLRVADLRAANLRGADLREANLRGADLRAANLREADLREADLREADLREAKDIPKLIAARLSILPAGELTVYKRLAKGVICTLRIPADALRSNSTGRKCRASYAIVVEGEGVSSHDSSFIYRVGETVRPCEPFDENRWEECASGIHFFITREEAEAHT